MPIAQKQKPRTISLTATTVLFEKKTDDGRRFVKMLDKYTIPKDKMEAIMRQSQTYDVFQKKCREYGVDEHEMLNYTYSLQMIHTLQKNRIKYSKPLKVMEESGSDDN